MKLLLKFSFFLILSTFSLQGVQAQVPSKTQDSIISNLVRDYTEKLALTGKQQVLFKKKLQTFYLDKQELRQTMQGKDKLRALYELGQQENGEMRDILTGEQHDLYVRIKPSLQPLEELDVRRSQ